MNLTKYLNTRYGTGWVYDNHSKIWKNPDGRTVLQVGIGGKWKYVMQEGEEHRALNIE